MKFLIIPSNYSNNGIKNTLACMFDWVKEEKLLNVFVYIDPVSEI